MTDTLHDQPLDWTPLPDWQARAQRIADRLKQRQP